MFDYISKWHRELAIFCKIKPLILLEGNVLDSYQYPVDGSTPKGSILRLPEYLHYFFKDTGYQNIIFYDSIQGFYNNYEKGYLENFAKLRGTSSENGYIRADFRSTRDNSVAALTRRILSQNKEASVIVMDFVSRYIISPDNMTQAEVDSFTSLIQASLEAKNVRTNEHGTLKNLLILITNKSNDIPVVAIVGYTNAGKSTLMNHLMITDFCLIVAPHFRPCLPLFQIFPCSPVNVLPK